MNKYLSMYLYVYLTIYLGYSERQAVCVCVCFSVVFALIGSLSLFWSLKEFIESIRRTNIGFFFIFPFFLFYFQSLFSIPSFWFGNNGGNTKFIIDSGKIQAILRTNIQKILLKTSQWWIYSLYSFKNLQLKSVYKFWLNTYVSFKRLFH